jgi:hypothetical protein
MNSEGMNALTAFKRYIVRKIYGPIKEEKSWRKRTSKGIQDTSQGAGIVKFTKSLR